MKKKGKTKRETKATQKLKEYSLLALILVLSLVSIYVWFNPFHDEVNYDYEIGDTLYINSTSFDDYQPISHFNTNTCSDYNFKENYLLFYKQDNYDKMKDICYLASGTFKEGDNEVGCSYSSADYTFKCDTENIMLLQDFCEEKLKGNWVCDNEIGYNGCVCGD